MSKIRLPVMIVAAALIVAGLLALRTGVPSASAKHIDPAPVGMGDLRRFEAQQAQSIRASVGMGDLRRFEAGQAISSRASVGMGDLRRFEASQSIP
jgi:hypothetical protein